MDGCRAPGLVLPAWARGGLRELIEARPHVRRLGGQACPRLRAWPLTAVLLLFLLLLLRYPERLHRLPVRELARPGHGRQGLVRGDEGGVRDRWRTGTGGLRATRHFQHGLQSASGRAGCSSFERDKVASWQAWKGGPASSTRRLQVAPLHLIPRPKSYRNRTYIMII